MLIRVNNSSKEIPPTFFLSQLIGEYFDSPFLGLAIAINNQVISKEFWNTHQLKEGDNIVVINATQGG
ncbi:MAG: sulfur carrier protein ThiS [Chitinophagaceae bacterium]